MPSKKKTTQITDILSLRNDGIVYPVKWTDETDLNKVSNSAWGSTLFKDNRLTISRELCDDRKLATLLHEYFHTRIPTQIHDTLQEQNLLEWVCDAFAGSVVALFSDNPKMKDFV